MINTLVAQNKNSAARSIADLQTALIMALDLSMQLKQAHWNVEGPNFVSLHRYFDELYSEMQQHVDELAERIVALDGTADGTVQSVAALTPFSGYPTDIRDGGSHLTATAERIAQFGTTVTDAQLKATQNGDEGTADILTGISIAVDKSLWFLNAQME